MPNLSITRQDIENHIETNVTTIPVVFDNVKADTSGLSEYTYVVIQFTNSDNVNIGAITSKRIRHTGTIVFKIYIPIDLGTGIGFTRMDEIKTALENQYLSENLLTFAADPAREGVGKEGYFAYFLRIPFVSDEC